MKTRIAKKHDQNVLKVYADRAKIYHKTNWTSNDVFIKKIIDFIDLKRADLVLGVGIGTGLIARDMITKVKDIYGIDPSVDMLNQLPPSIKRANMINMKAEKMPYLDKAFDLVYWRSVIMHVLNPQEIINESYRITKDGGRIFVVEPAEKDHVKRDFIFKGIDLKDDTHHFYFTVADLYDRLKKAGYKNLKHIIHTERLSFSTWMAGGAVSEARQKRIWNYFNNAPDKFKKAFHIEFKENDFEVDINWIVLKGEK
jgi:ubiquinone/menaquinone biosynthesis C-methylase UbiE